MNEQFWKVAEEGAMNVAIRGMDAKFQAAMRASLGVPEPKQIPVAKPEPQKPARRRRDVLDLRSVDQILEISRPSAITWKSILWQVAQKHGVAMTDLASIRRDVRSVAARHEAMYRLRNETAMSLPAIGRRMGGRDHSTIMHGIRAHVARMEAAAQ